MEHYLKTRLLRDCSRNDKEDGYEIIEELFNKHSHIKENVHREDNNSACSDLVLKYKDNFCNLDIVEV